MAGLLRSCRLGLLTCSGLCCGWQRAQAAPADRTQPASARGPRASTGQGLRGFRIVRPRPSFRAVAPWCAGCSTKGPAGRPATPGPRLAERAQAHPSSAQDGQMADVCILVFRLIRYCKTTRDNLCPSVWGPVSKGEDPYAQQAGGGGGCCSIQVGRHSPHHASFSTNIGADPSWCSRSDRIRRSLRALARPHHPPLDVSLAHSPTPSLPPRLSVFPATHYAIPTTCSANNPRGAACATSGPHLPSMAPRRRLTRNDGPQSATRAFLVHVSVRFPGVCYYSSFELS